MMYMECLTVPKISRNMRATASVKLSPASLFATANGTQATRLKTGRGVKYFNSARMFCRFCLWLMPGVSSIVIITNEQARNLSKFAP
jgi:hypothetical protein